MLTYDITIKIRKLSAKDISEVVELFNTNSLSSSNEPIIESGFSLITLPTL